MWEIKGEKAAQLSHATTGLKAWVEPLSVEVESGGNRYRGPVVAMDEESMIIEPVTIIRMERYLINADIGGSRVAPVSGATLRIF